MGIQQQRAIERAILTTVLYPRSRGKRFDMSYYLNTHMPLAEKLWGPQGMKTWTVTEFNGGQESYPFRLSTSSQWVSKAHLETALKSNEGARLIADFQNFTDEEPLILVGGIAGEWPKPVTSTGSEPGDNVGES